MGANRRRQAISRRRSDCKAAGRGGAAPARPSSAPVRPIDGVLGVADDRARQMRLIGRKADRQQIKIGAAGRNHTLSFAMPWIGIESLRNRVDVPSPSLLAGVSNSTRRAFLQTVLSAAYGPNGKALFGSMPSAITLAMKACSNFGRSLAIPRPGLGSTRTSQ